MADPTPALKDWFDVTRYRHLAGELSQLHRGFDANRFVKLAAAGLDELSLMQRLRRTSECLRATLPDDFHQALTVLRDLAPRINHGFVTLVLPDFVGLYGREHFDASMEALKYFTRFGSAEFAVREFLRLDLERALATMTPRVRRLPSASAVVVPAGGVDPGSGAGRADPGKPESRSEPLRAEVGGESPERHHQGSPGLGDGSSGTMGSVTRAHCMDRQARAAHADQGR
jgi:hypothetical protein